MNKRFEYVEPQIVSYDTEYLDYIEGNVSDYGAEPAVLATVQPSSRLVLPAARETHSSGLSAVMGHLLTANRSSGESDATAIQHMQAMGEKSSPRDRAAARLVLWAGWGAVATVLSIALYMVGLRGDLVWGIFVAIVGYGVMKTTQDENKHSPAGVERHKSEVYRDVRLAQIQADDRANARNHETFKEVLRHVYRGDDNA